MKHPAFDSHLRQRSKRWKLTMGILTVLIVICFLISMNSGFLHLAPLDVLKTIFGGGTDQQRVILFDLRLPRIVISVLIGAGLAVSGCIMQGISRNPLAEPGILGINAGAGLAVMIYVAFYPGESQQTAFMMPVFALGGAAITAAIIYVLAYKKNEGMSPTRLVLNGIGIASGIAALMIVLSVRVSPEEYRSVYTWLAGSISGTTWKYVISLLPWLIILLPFVFYKAKVLNVLTLGDPAARGVGAPLEKERFGLLAAAVGLAASCVAVGGGISFVGLIGPHLARRLVGPNHQQLLPTSALLGGLMVLVSDTIGRSVLSSGEVPTGIVVAIIGAPYFLYLLAKARG
ncbi:iron ABC transporter permease [Paenibacillus sp. CAA11]|uniref:FecCD family ABC transporter permease n=1 Tax=Paenibacillus sp. CAA11 TaxID=1532905 RepID=UPI000D38EED0|nr:iron ABC transporter permease [Paenibacillus sp. CAA11]AWB44469.1 iron ABC transporter permease [Paenibacillus sp. CAA11]